MLIGPQSSNSAPVTGDPGEVPPMSRKPGVTEYPCGCSHDVHRWLKLCPKHEAEWIETHTRWAGEKAGLIVALAATVPLSW